MPLIGQLDRKRDQPLDFFGHQRRGRRVDLHLHRRRVGKGVEVQRPRRIDADERHDQRKDHHDGTVVERPDDDASGHVFSGRERPW